MADPEEKRGKDHTIQAGWVAQGGEAGHREGPSATAEEVMPELKEA